MLVAIKADLEAVSMLEIYATTYRYPSPAGRIQEAPDPTETRQWFEALKAITQAFCVHFRITPTDPAPVARNPNPIR